LEAIPVSQVPKTAYLRQVEMAIQEWKEKVLPEFPDSMELDGPEPSEVQQANDELMLAVYEHTRDRRRG
jgi:hypothetical protein